MRSSTDRKIVFDARMCSASGVGRYIKEILLRLDSYNIECLILPEDKEFFVQHNISYTIVNVPIYSIKEQFLLPKAIPPCTIFWSPHFNIPIFPIKSEKRLVTIHDVFHLANIKTLSKKQQLYAKLMFRMALKKADQVITVSNFSKNEILKYVGTSFDHKIKVILNGTSIFSDESIKQCYAPNEKYFLYVGNIKPHKNLKRAILAFYEFLKYKEGSDFYFVLIGKREGFLNGEEGINSLLELYPILKERIIFTDYVKDNALYSLYKEAYCLIFPSLYEGFGLPPLEAMKVGTPAIVSNAASMPEICGNAALYFNPLNIDSIKETMLEIVKNPEIREDLVVKGVKRADSFNWDNSANEHKIIIDTFLS